MLSFSCRSRTGRPSVKMAARPVVTMRLESPCFAVASSRALDELQQGAVGERVAAEHPRLEALVVVAEELDLDAGGGVLDDVVPPASSG